MRSYSPWAQIQVATLEMHTALDSISHLRSKEKVRGHSRSRALKGVQLPLPQCCPLHQLQMGPWHPTCCCCSAEAWCHQHFASARCPMFLCSPADHSHHQL